MSIVKGSLNLSALVHVKMEVKGKSGDKVKGIFVPLSANRITETEKGGIYLNLVAFEMKEKKDWGTHIVKQSLSKEERSKMSEEDQKSMPILGNLNIDNTPNETVNNAAEGKTFTEESDDLPF